MDRIYISYSRVDRPLAEAFKALLYGSENAFYDQRIHAGQHYWPTILRAIARCELLIYLISNDSLASLYCQAELREALRLQKPILPVIIRPNTDYPASLAPDLKPALEQLQLVDLTAGVTDKQALIQLITSINKLLNPGPRR